MKSKYFVVERTANLSVKQVTHLNCLRELLPAVTGEVSKMQATARGCGGRLKIHDVRKSEGDVFESVKALSFADTTHWWMQRGLNMPVDTSWFPVESGEWLQVYGSSVKQRFNGLQLPKLGVIPIEGCNLYRKLCRLIIPLDARVSAEQQVYLLYDPKSARSVAELSVLFDSPFSDADANAGKVDLPSAVSDFGQVIAKAEAIVGEIRPMLSRMDKLSEDIRRGAELLREALADEISA